MDERRLICRKFAASNGRSAYGVLHSEPTFVADAAKILHTEFGFGLVNDIVFGGDIVLAKCSCDCGQLTLAWDIWCEFCVIADTPDGDSYVERFAAYVDAMLADRETSRPG